LRIPALRQDGYAAEMGPFPTDDMELTRLLVVRDLQVARDWYVDVLGATLEGEYGGTSLVLRIVGAWLLVVTGGGPTEDKPSVTFVPPDDPDRVGAELIFRVPDCRAAYETLAGRGASFLHEPVDNGYEVRASFRDPDGHLFEISSLHGGRG
jgi:catechol 2,3-dioxygenase-like lactoylglutathione lyase family enzyme